MLNAKVMPINIKRSYRTFLVLTILGFGLTVSEAEDVIEDPAKGIRTVVIDAGHGGRDPGAVGKRAQEKDIALSIALKVGEYIEENIPEVEVIYTRKTDVFVDLWKRAEIANQAEADLFISIHVNAQPPPRTSAKGTLTLVLGQHRADENFDVAVRENSVILLEEDYETIYEGFNPESTESYIMFSLMQKTYFRQSIEFGDFVQDQFRERAQRRDLGVREQGILVLAQTSMPGVLVETGFLTNPEEEKYLMTDYGQEIISSAIYRGFKEYKEEIDKRSNFTAVVREETETTKAPEVPSELSGMPDDQIVFSVQIASSKNKIATDPSSFKGRKGVFIVEDKRWYKYLLEREANNHVALEKCEEVKSDFPDAFLVASKRGKLIPMNEALIEINR